MDNRISRIIEHHFWKIKSFIKLIIAILIK